MATTVLGSVVMLCNVATADSFSFGSLRMAHEVSKWSTWALAKIDLLEASPERFWSARRAEIRFSEYCEFALAVKLVITPSARDSNEQFPGNSVKFRKISRHLLCTGLTISMVTFTHVRSNVLFLANTCCKQRRVC